MVERGRDESVEVVGQVLLELLATHRGLGRGLQKNARLQARRGLGRHVRAALDDGVSDFVQKLVTDGTPQRVLAEGAVGLAVERAVEVVRQTLFKLCAQHPKSAPSLPLLVLPNRAPRSPFTLRTQR